MQGNVYTVNSITTLAQATQALEADFKEHRYLQVDIIFGKERSTDQNKLIYRLYNEAAKIKDGETAETIRYECKLNIGVPMLYAEDDEFRKKWKDKIKHRFGYEQLLAMMVFFPVTSRMNTDQLSRYAESVSVKYGVPLPEQ
ncbi:MAG: hypothetical protein V3V40_06160 [Nitrosomonadaceae bacterium]